MKKIVLIAKCLFKFVVYALALLAALAILGSIVDGESGNCADAGGVWDEDFEVCRFDCHHWNKNDGCILMSDAELEDFANNYCDKEEKSLYRCRMAKLEWSKRQLRDRINNAKHNAEKE